MRDKEVFLTDNLTSAWRNMDSTFASIKDYRDQLQANIDEIKIYNDQITSGTNALGQLADLLLRAEERRARSQLQYYQAICEYNKSLMLIHYWKGSLLDLNAIDLGEGAWTDKAYWDAEERARQRAGGMYVDYGYTRPAVISAGPVERGGLTEGNISDTGAGANNRDFGSPVPAVELPEDAAEEKADEDRPELEPPTAGRLPPSGAQFASGNSQPQTHVQQASGQISSRLKQGNFQWGAMDSASSQPAIANSSSRRSRSISDQPAPANVWRGR